MNTTKPITQRLLSIDAAKAVSILGVVAIHSYNNQVSEYVNYFLDYFRFGVPLFIVYSFYLLEKKYSNQNFKLSVFVSSRILRLLIPYLVYSLIYYFIFNLGKRNNILGIITGYFTGFGWAGQYYLLLLLQLTILYPFIKNIRLNRLRVILITIFLFLSFNIPFAYLKVSPLIEKMGIVPLFYSLPYLCIGINLAREELSKFKNKMPAFATLIILIITPTIIILENTILGLTKNAMIYASFSCILSVYIISYCFIYMESLVSRLPLKLKKSITFISKYCLGIYCLNPLIIAIINSFCELNPWYVQPDIQFLLVWLTSFCICLFLSSLLGKFKLFSPLVM